jgi:hypothetical protein
MSSYPQSPDATEYHAAAATIGGSSLSLLDAGGIGHVTIGKTESADAEALVRALLLVAGEIQLLRETVEQAGKVLR